MFAYAPLPCSFGWTPPIGSSSSSRNGAGRYRPRRPRSDCLRSALRRSGSPARCSKRSWRVTRVLRGAAIASASNNRSAQTSRSSGRPTSSSISKRPDCDRGSRASARSAPVVDTVGRARRLLASRTSRAGLASLAQFFGTAARPCHRALPDAQATAEILLRLLGLAQERGATTVADLAELAAPRVRKVYAKRSLAFGAPTSPGVYLFRDRTARGLYVGRARDLRARLRSYFRTDRQRPAVEAALAAVERIEWRVLGSELEASLEELRLIRELRPPANARGSR